MSYDLGALEYKITADTRVLQAEIDASKKAMVELKRQINAVDAAHKTGAMSADVHAKAMSSLRSQMDHVHRSLQMAKAGMVSTSRAMSDLGQAANRGGQKMLALGRIVDDLQYVGQNGQGLRPIINNMMEFSPKVGMAMLAIDLLFRSADKLAALWGAGGTKTEAEQMEALAKATARTVTEDKKLARYNRTQETEKGILGARPKAETNQKNTVTEILGEGPTDRILDELQKPILSNVRARFADEIRGTDFWSTSEKVLKLTMDNMASIMPKVLNELFNPTAEGNLTAAADDLVREWNDKHAKEARDLAQMQLTSGASSSAGLRKLIEALRPHDAKLPPGILTRLQEALRVAEGKASKKELADEAQESMRRWEPFETLAAKRGVEGKRYDEFRSMGPEEAYNKLKDSIELYEQCMEGQGEMLENLSKEAEGMVAEGYKKTLRDILTQSRHRGDSAKVQLDVLTKQIEEELKKLSPALARFPRRLAESARGIAIQAREANEHAIRELMQAEQLTEAQAVQRMAIHRQAEVEDNRTKEATAQFTMAAMKENAIQRMVNPNAPKLTMAGAQHVARQRQEELEATGLSVENQIKVGQISNSAVGPQADAFFHALIGMGADPKLAYEETIRTFEGGKRVNFGAALNRSMNQIARAQMRQQGRLMRGIVLPGQQEPPSGRRLQIQEQRARKFIEGVDQRDGRNNQQANPPAGAGERLPRPPQNKPISPKAFKAKVDRDAALDRRLRAVNEENELMNRPQLQREQPMVERRKPVDEMIKKRKDADQKRFDDAKRAIKKMPGLNEKLPQGIAGRAGFNAAPTEMMFGGGTGMASFPTLGEGAGEEQSPVEQSNKLLTQTVELLTQIKDKPVLGLLS